MQTGHAKPQKPSHWFLHLSQDLLEFGQNHLLYATAELRSQALQRGVCPWPLGGRDLLSTGWSQPCLPISIGFTSHQPDQRLRALRVLRKTDLGVYIDV